MAQRRHEHVNVLLGQCLLQRPMLNFNPILMYVQLVASVKIYFVICSGAVGTKLLGTVFSLMLCLLFSFHDCLCFLVYSFLVISTKKKREREKEKEENLVSLSQLLSRCCRTVNLAVMENLVCLKSEGLVMENPVCLKS